MSEVDAGFSVFSPETSGRVRRTTRRSAPQTATMIPAAAADQNASRFPVFPAPGASSVAGAGAAGGIIS
jgi:hypothetical protein